MKSDYIIMRVTPELKAEIQAAADAEDRTVTNWIMRLIKKALDQEKRSR